MSAVSVRFLVSWQFLPSLPQPTKTAHTSSFFPVRVQLRQAVRIFHDAFHESCRGGESRYLALGSMKRRFLGIRWI